MLWRILLRHSDGDVSVPRPCGCRSPSNAANAPFVGTFHEANPQASAIGAIYGRLEATPAAGDGVSLPAGRVQRARTRTASFVVSTAHETSLIDAEIVSTFCEMARTASAAPCMLDDISRVTTLCSSTAAAVLTT